MHLRSFCVHIARISGDVEVLVLLFQEQLGVSCGPVRVWRNGNTEGQQELSDVEELGTHDGVFSMNSNRQASGIKLEECDYQFPAGGLTFTDPVFPTCKGLVFSHEDKGLWCLGDPVHETLLEDTFDVVPPSLRKRACQRLLEGLEGLDGLEDQR